MQAFAFGLDELRSKPLFELARRLEKSLGWAVCFSIEPSDLQSQDRARHEESAPVKNAVELAHPFEPGIREFGRHHLGGTKIGADNRTRDTSDYLVQSRMEIPLLLAVRQNSDA